MRRSRRREHRDRLGHGLNAIVLDGDAMYWTSRATSGGMTLTRKKSGGATYVLAKDQYEPSGSVRVTDKRAKP